MSWRLFRYSFVRFCFLATFVWIVFLLYISTWNQSWIKAVDRKFSDFDVDQMIKGRIVDVVERNLRTEEGDIDIARIKNIIEEDEAKEERRDKPRVLEKIANSIFTDEILDFHRRLNLTNPGHMGAPVNLPEALDLDIIMMVNRSIETYQVNEFVANLIPLDRELPDFRTDYCKTVHPQPFTTRSGARNHFG
jgi:hypothetical protein